jgi:Na+/H+ antiporter NhaD/arsenite permease-like protein
MEYRFDDLAAGTVSRQHIAVSYLLGNHAEYIKAISISAVFFGAVTYIGNGPNFMVKSIAEQQGVPCPSFFGYLVKYALPILLPVFILIWLVFFR